MIATCQGCGDAFTVMDAGEPCPSCGKCMQCGGEDGGDYCVEGCQWPTVAQKSSRGGARPNAGRPALPASERRSTSVRVPMSTTEKARYLDAAQGSPLATWLRRLADAEVARLKL